MVALVYILSGFTLGMITIITYTSKYFDKNPYEIRWKGRTYVFVDKPDTNDSNSSSGL